MYALKALMTALGSGMTDCRPPMSGIDPSMPRSAYLFNPSIAGIEQADAILIVGANPRKEASLINARIRKTWRAKGMPIARDRRAAPTSPTTTSISATASRRWPTSPPARASARSLAKAKKPLVIVGEAAVSHGAAWSKQIGRDVIALAAQARDHEPEHRRGLERLCAAPPRGGPRRRHRHRLCAARRRRLLGRPDQARRARATLDVLFLLGADEYDTTAMGKAFVVYIGTHGDAGAHRADVILPAATYTEKSATYVNTEGRVQQTERAVFPPGDAKEDWAIFRALSRRPRHAAAVQFAAPSCAPRLYAEFPHLARLDQIAAGDLPATQGAGQDRGQDHVGAATPRRSPTSTSPTRSRAPPR